MKRRLTLAAVTLVVLTLVGTIGINVYSDYKTNRISQQIDSKIDGIKGGYNGSVLIAKDGKIVLEKGYGFADIENNVRNTPETIYCIASVTKQFTALAVLMLEERGLLNVNDMVSKYIPDLPNGDKITIHNLLTMSSGLDDKAADSLVYSSDQNQSISDVIQKIENKDLHFTPGSEYDYVNTNYIILGYIIEKASGVKYEDFMCDNIFKPLQMNSTGFNMQSKHAVAYSNVGKTKAGSGLTYVITLPGINPAGGIYTNVLDLYKWDQALYTEKLVKKSTIDRVFKGCTDMNFKNYSYYYGYGWMIVKNKETNKMKFASHGGDLSGYLSTIIRCPEKRLFIVSLSNEHDVYSDNELKKYFEDVVLNMF